MTRVLMLVYGLVSYIVFLATSLYSAGFVGNYIVPKTIDSGGPGPLGATILINSLLLGFFAVQHSVMARQGFKRLWTRVIPEPIERSTYNLVSSFLLILLIWQWRPMTDVVWSVEDPTGRFALTVLYAAGWALVVYSTFLINHFDFFGLRQAYFHFRGREYTQPQFKTPFLYRIVRHPIMLGFLIAFWSAPRMTAGHLFFAAASSAYILVGIRFEEGDLARSLGPDYEEYRRRVPMLLPFLRRPDGKERGRP